MEEEEEEEEEVLSYVFIYLFIYLFLFFWSFLTLWSIRRRTEERVDTQLSVIFGHFDNNFVFFSVSIFTAHSLDGRAVLVKIKTTFFFYLGKKEGKKKKGETGSAKGQQSSNIWLNSKDTLFSFDFFLFFEWILLSFHYICLYSIIMYRRRYTIGRHVPVIFFLFCFFWQIYIKKEILRFV